MFSLLSILLAFTQLSNEKSFSQTNSWFPLNGPNGASVRTFARDSCGGLYVATDGGVYRSDDNGNHWEFLQTPRTYVSNSFFDIAPLGCRTVVAHGTEASFRSTDRGSTWRSEDASRWGFRMDSLGRVYSSSQDGIWISYDTALTWIRFSLAGKTVRSILMPGQGRFFCLVDSSMYRSSDGGSSWYYQRIPRSDVTKITMNSHGVLFARSFRALLRSTDAGVTWMTINPPGNITYVEDILNHEPNELWAATSNGVYCSTNAGDTWVHKGYKEEYVLSLGLDLQGEVLIGTFEALSRYSRSSGQWIEQNNGLHSLRITSVAFGKGNIIAATGMTRVYFSTDGGSSWIQSYNFPKNYSSGPVVSLPSGAFLTFSYDSILRSTDNGTSWTQNIPSQSAVISDLAANGEGTVVLSLHSGEVLISSDDGNHWRTILSKGPLRPMRAVTIDNCGSIYALTDSSTLFVSMNMESWEELRLPDQWSWNSGSVFVDNSGAIYISSHSGILRSTDRGRSWTTYGDNFINYPGRKIAVDRQGNVFAAGLQTVYRLADGMDAWEPIGAIVGSPGFITSLAVTPDGIVYAGTQEDGLFRGSRQFGRRIPTPPESFLLAQNFPNPFNSRTTIEYQLPKAAVVSLRIYNVLGQLISSLVHEYQEAGSYQVRWEAKAPSGIYFYRLQTRDFVETKKMLLLR